jgi:hypothetical protein
MEVHEQVSMPLQSLSYAALPAAAARCEAKSRSSNFVGLHRWSMKKQRKTLNYQYQRHELFRSFDSMLCLTLHDLGENVVQDAVEVKVFVTHAWDVTWPGQDPLVPIPQPACQPPTL